MMVLLKISNYTICNDQNGTVIVKKVTCNENKLCTKKQKKQKTNKKN